MGCVCTKKSIRIDGVNYAIVEHIGDGWVFTILLWINGVGSNQSAGKSLSEAFWGEQVVYKNCSECQKQFLYPTCSP